MASVSSTQKVTKLLQAWGQGEDAALNELLSLVYPELHRIARRHMFGERTGRTLQTTALVNEDYLRLVKSQNVNWQNRAQLFCDCRSIDAANSGGLRSRARRSETRRRNPEGYPGCGTVELFYRNGDKLMVVQTTLRPSFSAGDPKVLFEGRYATYASLPDYDVSPDGQHFLFLKTGEEGRAEINVVVNWTEELKQKIPQGKN